MLMSYVADGTWYCKGTFQRLANALADTVTEAGGEVLLRSPVRRIRTAGGAVEGVVLENGQAIAADTVVSNADARQTVEELCGQAAFAPSRVRRIQRLTPSVSAFVVYAASRMHLAPGTSHENFAYDTWDHDRAFRAVLSGEPRWLTATIPTLSDPDLAPPGEHVVVLTTLVAHDAVPRWRDVKEAWKAALLDRADRVLPGFKAGLTFAEAGTPRTMERYTRNTDGALYGWALTPGQVGPGRPPHDTGVRGLHLAGHWTQPGGGVVGVVGSGLHAARHVLGLEDEAALWRAVRTSG